MEDIYGNLDNYEDGNVIDELKSENKELKFKLEEYASTLSNLQKDFDKLSSEYKKLELNYSSLLKTARSEIERKTTIITNLNLEKDQLILNTFQKIGRITPINYKKNHNKENTQQTEQQSGHGTNSRKLKDDVSFENLAAKNEPTTLHTERNNTSDKTTFSSGSSGKIDSDVKEKETKLKPTEDPNRYRDKYKNDTKEFKENPTSDLGTEKVRDDSRIRLRRKSMPLLNHGDCKFSSDEEQDEKTDNIREHRLRRKSPVRDVVDRKYDRDRNNKYGSKEPPFLSHRESVRDNYYKSSSRYNDNDWHRMSDARDRYDTRYKNRWGTDRYRYNTRREYSNEHSHRTDYGRYRATASSPPEKHSFLHRSRDVDRYRFQNEEEYGLKHKIHDGTDEPSQKRIRTESPKRQSDEHIAIQRDRNIAFQAAPVPHLLPYLSLQSPDYNILDPGHKIKEIKGTATVKLDDPRLKSNKYVLNTHNEKVVLSTVVGRNVEIKGVDKDVWVVDKEIQKMPTLLREKPQINEDLISQIYMDINNPISNLSLESNEVDSGDINDLPLSNVDNADKRLNSIKTDAVGTNIFNVKCDQPEINKHQTQNETKLTKTQTEASDHVLRKWRIPLLNKSYSKPLEDLTTETKKVDKKDNTRHCHKKNSLEEKREEGDKNKQQEVNPLKLNLNNRRHSKNKTKDHLPEISHEAHFVEKPIISVRDTVVGDLELSDETSDCTEFVEQTRYSKEKVPQSEECTREPVIVRIPREKLKEHSSDVMDNQQGVFKYEIEKLCKTNSADKSKLNTDAQTEESIKQKEIKLNKDKEDIKVKLSDLFGDSSSLITPDDLGFVDQPLVNPIANKYSPLFDNTQDAIDLNVEEMEKVQTRLKIKNGETVINSNKQDAKPDKKHKSKSSKTNSERKKKHRNALELTSAMEHNSENLRGEVLNKEPNVVKTVVISTGVQNNSQTEDIRSLMGPEILPNTLSLPNLQALATSTPHKTSLIEPSSSAPDGNNSETMSTNSSNVKGNTEDVSKINQNDSDVPEFRIVVKRRRKARAPN